MPPNAFDSRPSVEDNYVNEDLEEKSLGIEKGKWFEFKTELIWSNIIVITTFQIVSVYFILTFPYRKEIVLTLWTFVMCQLSGLGVTGGVHRLWTHRSYKAKLPLRILLAIFYCSAGMNRIYDWVRDHRIHHKYTETDADPHNSARGFWFSHVGWLMMKKHPEVQKRGRAIDMSDVEADPVVIFFDQYRIHMILSIQLILVSLIIEITPFFRHFMLMKIIFCFIVPIIIPVHLFNQNWSTTIVSELFIRYPIVLNGTWSVNSFAHIWGYRSYDKTIKPTENLLVSLVSVGEGWHNYHHVFPWDYKAAEFGHVIFNPTTIWINLFSKIGWAYDLKEASSELVEKVAENRGDGSHFICTKLNNM